jgi:hypothetical protein
MEERVNTLTSPVDAAHRTSRQHCATVPLLFALAACGGSDAKMAPADAARPPESSRPGAAAPAIDTLPSRPDPCAWVTLGDAKSVLGEAPVKATRVFSVSNPTPDPAGRACQYDLAATGPDGTHGRLVVSVDPTGDLANESVGKMLNQRLAKDAPGTIQVDTTIATRSWDASVWNFDVYHGRLGSLTVEIGTPDWAVVKVDRGKIEALAALVRDKVPDKPFASRESSQAPEGDPCSLVSVKDVEALVGPVKLPPFRSTKGDPVFENGGSSCTYWLGRHRALTIAAEWSNGKDLFKFTTMAGHLVENKLGVLGESADTLEGTWDQAASAAGAFVVLKGDRMVSVGYQPAAVDVAVAAKLATKALATLAKP